MVIEETIFGKNKDNLIILFGKKNVNRIEKNLLLKKDTIGVTGYLNAAVEWRGFYPVRSKDLL